ncbi:MAG: Hpt domain-containing protein [Lachnospiraceae bacterium]|nr:Hpt domain-containing protein [Lachnospiraceae bacterium]
MALIDKETGIMYCGDDEDIYSEILGVYVDLVVESREVLIEALAEDNMPEYIRRVHAVKSNSRNVGALVVGDLAELLEHAAKEDRKDYVIENHPELMKLLTEVEAEARDILGA